MFHTAVYEEAIANVANTELDAVADQWLDRNNLHYRLARDMDLVAAFLSSVTMVRGRLRYPSINQFTGTWIDPISPALLPPTDYNLADFRRNPFRVPKNEELVIEATSALACGTEQAYAVLWLADQMQAAPRGQTYTIRGTSTTAGVAQTWTLATMTWDIQLPEGQYVVTGGRMVSTTGIAWRLFFENQLPRPGALSLATNGLRGHEMFRRGGLGVWGMFRSTFMPQVEILDNATGNAHTLFLDCVRVSNSVSG